jgi:hypothetical protein
MTFKERIGFEKEALLYNLEKAMQYVSRVMKDEVSIPFMSLLICIGLNLMTLYLDYNGNCLPSELSKGNVAKCPLKDYIVIQFRNIFNRYF